MTKQIQYFHVNTQGEFTAVANLADAQAATEHGGYFWIDYCEPEAEDLFALVPALGLHPLSIEDSINAEQLPKIDLFDNYTFMIFNIFEPTPEELVTRELDLFLGDKFLISVSNRDSKGEPLLKDIMKLFEREKVRLRQGPAFLLHNIVDVVVDKKFLAVEDIEEKLELFEDQILANSKEFQLSELMGSRRDLQVIRKTLFHEREVVSKIIRQDSRFIPERALIYFRDVYDHLSKYYELSDSARDLVTGLMEINLSMISNRMSLAANRTNAIMRRLTLITTIFMPLTLISGIGGMSEFTMFVGQENSKTAYVILTIVMVGIAVLVWIMLKRMERSIPRDHDSLERED